MKAPIPCCRCGGHTRIDQFGQGVCIDGTRRKACGFWWKRSGRRCQWTWADWSKTPGAYPCPGCGSDHAVFFTPTHTAPDGTEHRYHSPAHGIHRTIAVVRPKGQGRRLSELRLSPPHPAGPVDAPEPVDRLARIIAMYGKAS